jgi:hypothetical protein
VRRKLVCFVEHGQVIQCKWSVCRLRPLGPTHDVLDHHGRDAREHGFCHWGRQCR